MSQDGRFLCSASTVRLRLFVLAPHIRPGAGGISGSGTTGSLAIGSEVFGKFGTSHEGKTQVSLREH